MYWYVYVCDASWVILPSQDFCFLSVLRRVAWSYFIPRWKALLNPAEVMVVTVAPPQQDLTADWGSTQCFWDHALCLNQSSSKCQWLQGCTFTEMILQWHMASRHGANPKQNVGETGTVKFKKDTAKWKLWIKGNAWVRKGSEEQWTWAVSWREWNIQMGRQLSHELHYQNIQVSSPYV